MNYTKGEWKKRKVNSYGKEWFEINYSSYGECVAEVVHNEADADLFAAAPDMYEALKRMVNFINAQELEYQSSMVIQLKSALAKAEGKTI